ncbi:MAG: GC-type dockerin domain-anchored protein [Planctomycetota bacterium]
MDGRRQGVALCVGAAGCVSAQTQTVQLGGLAEGDPCPEIVIASSQDDQLVNGDFTIVGSAREPDQYLIPSIRDLGDARNEITYFAFDLSGDPGFAALIAADPWDVVVRVATLAITARTSATGSPEDDDLRLEGQTLRVEVFGDATQGDDMYQTTVDLAGEFGSIAVESELLAEGSLGFVHINDMLYFRAELSLTVDILDCDADTNRDGAVTPADFNAWVSHFNTRGPGCDQNGDRLCDPSDFNAWVLNYNAGCP